MTRADADPEAMLAASREAAVKYEKHLAESASASSSSSSSSSAAAAAAKCLFKAAAAAALVSHVRRAEHPPADEFVYACARCQAAYADIEALEAHLNGSG